MIFKPKPEGEVSQLREGNLDSKPRTKLKDLFYGGKEPAAFENKRLTGKQKGWKRGRE